MQFDHPLKKTKMEHSNDQEIQELDLKSLNRFSRQNAALGAETTAKLLTTRVIIFGLRGVGIETAKNLSLQGAGAITIVDSNPVSAKDTGVNFFLTHADVAAGHTRSEAIVPRLHDLNPLCRIRAAPALTEELVLAHNALVITEFLPTAELVRWDEFCRVRRISFFYSFVGGLSTSIFVDHGDHHVVVDPNGEKPVQKLIVGISPIGEGEALIRYDHPSGALPEAISTGHFEFSEVVGADGINGHVLAASRADSDPVKTVRVKWDASASTPYVSGGLLTEKKVPVPHPMKSLAEKIRDPGSAWADPPTLVLTDLLNFGAETQQHVSLWAVQEFVNERGRFPALDNADDADVVVAIAKRFLSGGAFDLDGFDLDETYVRRFANLSSIQLQPLAAFAGGVLAQEVVKVTGKFTPIPGFLHFSAFEALPDERPTAEETAPRNHRNDELAALYGWPFVETLGNLKYFMVGCGALGCEFLKNFALNGVCCGPSGSLSVTDADRIELSNLTRQFLFREHNVGQPKSVAAGVMAKQMNPDFKVDSLEQFVGPKTEEIFNDAFWLGLDGVCNALDNMEARQYVDAQCVKYEKSLLESGTMGTSGNIDTICPFKTRTYREGGQAVEGGGVPMCTLRNFPQITDHCIEWARDQFASLFVKLIKSCEAYVADPEAFKADMLSQSETAIAVFTIRSVTSLLRAVAEPSIGAVAQVAFDIFHFLFRDKILDLQRTFPADKRIIGKDGTDKGPFWGEKKRFPTVATFNPADESHTSFLLSGTCLFGVAIGLIAPKQEDDPNWLKEYRSPTFVAKIAESLRVPEYVFCPVSTDDAEPTEPVVDKEAFLGGLLKELNDVSVGLALPPLAAADFEKDDDFNFHIAFITAAANLRCDNYSIKRTNFHECKVIAGKIIAAIATTTAAVCGLVVLELFKLVLKKPTDSYMNRQIGLAVNAFTSFTADPPRTFQTFTEVTVPSHDELPPEAFDEKGLVKEQYQEKTQKRAYPEKHSVWNKIEVSGRLTVKQFAEWLAAEHRLRLKSWNFVIGYKPVLDEDGKKTGVAPVTSPVYPATPILDYSLLPSLDLTLGQATTAIMRNQAAKPTQQYIGLWKKFKEAGAIPAAPEELAADVITENTTIVQVLERMERLGAEAEAAKTVESRTVTGVARRLLWVVPGSEAPSCQDIETSDDVEFLASIKFTLA